MLARTREPPPGAGLSAAMAVAVAVAAAVAEPGEPREASDAPELVLVLACWAGVHR